MKDKIKTVEQALAAVQRSGWALKDVPEEFKTYEVCLTAVENNYNESALQYVPEELKTYEFCLAAVQHSLDALKYVPEELKTYEVCLAAAQSMGVAIQYVPKKHITTELCLAAVQRSGIALSLIPKEFKTYEVCLAAVQCEGYSLAHVPEEFKTAEFFLKMVQPWPPNIYYIPDEFITDAFVSILLDNIEDISTNFDNEKDVRCFIAKFPLQFREKVAKRIIDSYGIVDLCKCKQRKTKNICVVGMGNDDDDIYATMERVKRRGEPYWWLYLSKCKICNEYWLTGQDHSINDIYCLYRLNPKQANDIIKKDNWPNVFDKFENLLEIAKENNICWSFCDPVNDSPLENTIENLAIERPCITVSELAKLLNIDIETTLLLSKRAMENNVSVKITFDV